MNESSAQPLSRVPIGQTATVVALEGGQGFQSRLISMGLTVGSEVRVIRGGAGAWGPTLIALGQARLAIGRGMADKILVSPCPAPRSP
ncbi:MAG TPA: FeoA family protein [Phycisphaerae bacterium]|nr:FeoA family protein [Phycisphaerae bacterium]